MAEDTTVSQLFSQMYFIEQFVESVVSVTSKYNTSRSILYAPDTIIGKPGNYPNYGDFSDTYMLRSYGKWWKKSENYQTNYMPQDYDDVESEDYIIVKFEQPVIATKIAIYETYNTGAVVRLWGGSGNGIWKLLWQGQPQKSIQSANLFAPEIKIIKDVIYLLRIDFNQNHLRYHTAIDGVLLAGYKSKTPIQTKLFMTAFLLDDKEKNINQKCDKIIENSESPFSILPYEIIVYIFGYLDLKSLCACAQVNKMLNGASSDTLLYRQISFRRYWHQVTDNVLENFMRKCKFLCKLDLSWCCSELISESVFVRFLENCSSTLSHLSLGNCDFVGENAIEQIAKCSELIELRLRNVMLRNASDFHVLNNLSRLITLDLFATNIDDESLIKILINNAKLKHLNIEICENLKNLDKVMERLSLSSSELRTISCWKDLSLTSEGVKSLSKCRQLREIDLGWVLFEPNEALLHVGNNCPHLTRLILSACRTLTDNQLWPVIRSCPELRQLDLLGIRGLTVDICERALKHLPHLELLDISFCDGIQAKQVDIWTNIYTNVTILTSCEQVNQANHQAFIIPI